VVEALPHLIAALKSSGPPGTIVTLGTPFIDTKSPISRTRKHRLAVVNAVALIPIASLTLALYFKYFEIIQKEIALLIGIWISINAAAYVRTSYHSAPSDSEAAGTQLPFLAIGSPMDEAWQILYHIRNINNPLAVRLNLISYVFSSSRSLMLQTAEVEHMLGAKSFREMSVAGKWKVIPAALTFDSVGLCK
jgi:hypothetical protein